LKLQYARKQDAWVDNIRKILETRSGDLDSEVKSLLNQVVNYDNIPRKRAKFVNFVQNAIGKRTPTSVIDKTWDVFEEAIKTPKVAVKEETSVQSTPESSGNEKENDKKKGQIYIIHIYEKVDLEVCFTPAGQGEENAKKKAKSKASKHKNSRIDVS